MAQAIKKIKVGTETHPIDGAFYLGTLSTVAGSAASGSYKSVRWYVSDCEGVTAPYDGMRIAIKIPLAGVGTAGAILSINGNNDADYHPLAYNVNTVLTTHFPVNSIKVFVYDANQTMTCYKTAGTSVSVTGVWKADSNYDSNTVITYGTMEYYFRPYNGANPLYRYKFVALDKDNRIVALTTTNVANGTAVTNITPTNVAFRPDKIWWYSTTTTIAASGLLGAQTLWRSGYNANNTSNGGMAICNFNETVSAYRLIYLCGTYNKTTGLFTLRDGGTASSKNYYKLVPTNTADITLSSYFTSGYDYILLGGTYSSNNYIQLFDNNPMFHFDGTNLVPYDSWANDDSNLVHKGTSSAVSNEDIYGTKTFKDGGVSFSDTLGSDTYNSWISTGTGKLIFRTRKGSSDLTQGNVVVNIPTLSSPTAQNVNIDFPTKSGTLATTDDIASKANDSDVVHKGTSSSASNEDIYGTKTFKNSSGTTLVSVGGANAIECSSAWADTTNSAVISKLVPISGKQSWIGTSTNRFAQSHVLWRYGSNISLTGTSPSISVGDTTSIPHSILSDGHLKLSSGSGSDSPAYIDFTGASGNGGTITLKSSNLSSGTRTVVIPAANGTLIVEDTNSHQAKVTDGLMAGTNPYATYRSRSIELGTSSSPSWTLTLPTKTGTILTDADLVSADNLVTADGDKGSSTKPVYYTEDSGLVECSTYAGGTAVTLNGSSKAASTASFYAPTSAITTTTAKRYLLGTSSTTSIATTSTTSMCYTESNHLYSYGRRLLEYVGGDFAAGPTSPRQNTTTYHRYLKLNYGTYYLLICWGLISKNVGSGSVTFPKSFMNVPIVLTSLMVDGDTQTQRGAPSSVSITGFSMSGNSGQAVAYIALGVCSSDA